MFTIIRCENNCTIFIFYFLSDHSYRILAKTCTWIAIPPLHFAVAVFRGWGGGAGVCFLVYAAVFPSSK